MPTGAFSEATATMFAAASLSWTVTVAWPDEPTKYVLVCAKVTCFWQLDDDKQRCRLPTKAAKSYPALAPQSLRETNSRLHRTALRCSKHLRSGNWMEICSRYPKSQWTE